MRLAHMIEDLAPFLEGRDPRGGGGHSSGHSSGSSGSSSSGGSSSSKGGGSSSSSSSSKSGSGSTKTSGGSTYYVGSTTYYSGGSSGTLPAWVYVLIAVLTIIAILFVCAVVHYSVRERKRKQEAGHRFRPGHVFWKAAQIALFIWVAVALWKCCSGRFGRRKSSAAKATGTYAKIEEGADSGDASHAWYGSASPSASPYGAGGTGYAPATPGRFEPMGYVGARGAAAANAEAAIAASPLGSPMSSSAGFGSPGAPLMTTGGMDGALASPPPYRSGNALDVPPKEGAAQSYFALSPPPKPTYDPGHGAGSSHGAP